MEELKTRIEYMDPGNHMSETIDYSRMNLAYFDPRLGRFRQPGPVRRGMLVLRRVPGLRHL